ncbi:hypothetical protein B296_00054313 [Ensete ventricosum]|uniref:Gamma-glutamylcyclotransferase n=1 Tax=Ensete ventricosum TaxID=4639 RepID=A0A426X595_ENSVE|nr:hypothetical protein B296_00054313 [Ensete ventricosum]
MSFDTIWVHAVAKAGDSSNVPGNSSGCIDNGHGVAKAGGAYILGPRTNRNTWQCSTNVDASSPDSDTTLFNFRGRRQPRKIPLIRAARDSCNLALIIEEHQKVQLELVRWRPRKEQSAFVSTPDKEANGYYLGPAPLQDMARQIATARGPCGNNRDYLFRLERALFDIGHEDDMVIELADEVRKVLLLLQEKAAAPAAAAPVSSPLPPLLMYLSPLTETAAVDSR